MKTRSKIKDSENKMEPDKVKQKLSRTEIMRRYRAKLKEKPARIEAAREKDRKRKRLKRTQQKSEILSGNKKLHEEIKSKNRKYMETYRTKLRSKKANMNKSEEQSVREQKSSLDKKRAVLNTQRWRMRIKLTDTGSRTETTGSNEANDDRGENSTSIREDTDGGEKSSTATTDVAGNCNEASKDGEPEIPNGNNVKSPSRWAIYRAKKRAMQSLPSTPLKKAAIVEHIIDSPRTAKILFEKGLCIPEDTQKNLDMAMDVMEGIKQHVAETKPTGTQESKRKTAYETVINTSLKASRKKTQLLKSLGLSKNKKRKGAEWWKQNPRKQRKDRINDNVKARVTDFYLSQEVSREVPNKKEVLCVKQGNSKEFVQKHVMTMTLADAYHTYKNKYPYDKVGLSTFKKLKPQHVRRVSETNRKSCLCQTCCNVALKSEALKSFLSFDSFKDVEKPPYEKHELMNKTLCKNADGKQHKNDCLKRECKECSTRLLRPLFEAVCQKSAHDDVKMTWYKWEHITVDREDSSSKRIISCVPKCTSFDEFLADLEKDMKEYPSHRFRATWQHDQLLKCLASLKENELMTIMDFSENYKCSFQNEVQSAYFDQNLVTIHPSMNYYKKTVDGKDTLIKHTIVGISNDLKHDSNLVRVLEDNFLNIIEKQINIESVKQWSDGCAAQYKSKVAFAYLSERKYTLSRNYFETSHGKNVCDGLGAIVKNSCYRAMLTGKVIANALDLFNHCENTLSHGLKLNEKDNTGTVREFIYVSKDDVDRTHIPEVTTLVGTRKVHNIRNTGTSLAVESRNLSCFCQACLTSESGDPCENIEYVESWKRSNLKRIHIIYSCRNLFVHFYYIQPCTVFMQCNTAIFSGQLREL